MQLARAEGPSSMQNPERNAVLAQHVKTSNMQLASDQIADVLEQRAHAAPRDSSALHKFYGRSRATIRTALKDWNSRKTNHKSSADYTLHRFPKTTLSEVEQRRKLMSESLGRFQSVCVKDIGDNVFRLKRR
jgi:hypothetical protein